MKVHERIKTILSEISDVESHLDDEPVERLVNEICHARRVFLFGQGRSGFVTRYFAVRLMHLGLDVHFVGDATTPPITSADLCLVNSGTGETRFSFHVVQAARRAGARTATITAHPQARISRLADIVVVLPAPTRGESVDGSLCRQPPGTLFEQSTLILLDTIILILMDKLGVSPQTLMERHANIE